MNPPNNFRKALSEPDLTPVTVKRTSIVSGTMAITTNQEASGFSHAFANLLKTMVGSGLLTLPYVTAQAANHPDRQGCVQINQKIRIEMIHQQLGAERALQQNHVPGLIQRLPVDLPGSHVVAATTQQPSMHRSPNRSDDHVQPRSAGATQPYGRAQPKNLCA